MPDSGYSILDYRAWAAMVACAEWQKNSDFINVKNNRGWEFKKEERGKF